jgi:ABC-type Fe3+ transport system permease subunit
VCVCVDKLYKEYKYSLSELTNTRAVVFVVVVVSFNALLLIKTTVNRAVRRSRCKDSRKISKKRFLHKRRTALSSLGFHLIYFLSFPSSITYVYIYIRSTRRTNERAFMNRSLYNAIASTCLKDQTRVEKRFKVSS